eukprot:UN24764
MKFSVKAKCVIKPNNERHFLYVHTSLTYHRKSLLCPLGSPLERYSHSFPPQTRCQISLIFFCAALSFYIDFRCP